MKYYLAIDKGRSQIPNGDNSDRYFKINIGSLAGTDSFSTINQTINFTGQFKNYSELFIKLYQNNLITEDLIGKPFTICYYSESRKKWDHLGTHNQALTSENNIFFKNEMELVTPPSDEKLKETYKELKEQKYVTSDEKVAIKFNLTKEILYQELFIPRFFDYDQLEQSEKDKVDFIKMFTNEVGTILNKMKYSMVYKTNSKYQYYVNILSSYNNDLREYVSDAINYGVVRSNTFSQSVIRIIFMLCTNQQDTKNQILRINTSTLYHLASFYKNYFDKKENKMENEVTILNAYIESLKPKEEPPFVQMDLWGSPIEEPAPVRKRSRNNHSTQ